jgi:hypothetical protein
MSRSQSRLGGAVLLACALAAAAMDAYELHDTGRIWILGTWIIPIGALLGPWWIVVGRPADPTTGRVPAWIVRGEATVTLVGCALGLAILAWWFGLIPA